MCYLNISIIVHEELNRARIAEKKTASELKCLGAKLLFFTKKFGKPALKTRMK
jgi:hypothetical protein